MKPLYFPINLQTRLEGYASKTDTIGESSASIIRFTNGVETVYLKSDEKIAELRCERDILRWLSNKLPVPEVLDWVEDGVLAYLLITAADGVMSCDDPRGVTPPVTDTIAALADGILKLQTIDITDCPFDNRLDQKLEHALYNIKHDLIDVTDWEQDNGFDSPMSLYNWLCDNRSQEDLCFTHGDYCMPNVFVDGSYCSGLIDFGRAGVADKYQDIALCVRSLGYNLDVSSHRDTKQQAIDELFSHLGITPDWDKIRYYILLDELF
jgi:kanamycin kinase/aminoglycoside 3'-phosphotransferase-3